MREKPEEVTVARVGDAVFRRDHAGREIAYRHGKPIGDLVARMDGYGGTATRFDQRPWPMPHCVLDRESGRRWIAAEDRVR